MPEPAKPDRLPPTVEALVFKISVAKTRDELAKFMAFLVKQAKRTSQEFSAFDKLSRVPTNGPELALEFVSLMPDVVPSELARAVLPLVKNADLSLDLRLAAAGKLLESMPDDRKSILPVTEALTSGLGKSASLERLLQVQRYVQRCAALDEYIAELEAEVSLRCPKCPTTLTRRELVKHLWAAHRLIYADGKASDPRRAELEEIITQAAVSDDPADLDQAYLYTELYAPDMERRLAFQSLAIRGNPDASQTNRLLALAEEDHCGLCSNCLSAVPDPVPELPPPASLASGRLSAEGYVVEVVDTPLGRLARMAFPDGALEPLPLRGQRLSPRLTAVFVALPLFLLAAIGVILIPAKLAQPLFVAFWLIVIAWIGYAIIRVLTKPLPDASSLAIDYAWNDLVPSINLSTSSTRFLIRLCRASIREGSPAERLKPLKTLIEEAERRIHRGGNFQQLLAAARILQVLDGARAGRDKINSLVELFDPYFRGELQAAYAEAAAEVLLSGDTLSEGDTLRLGVCLVGNCYNAGLTPADLLAIGRFGPMFRQLLLDASPSHLGQLYALWRTRHQQPWSAIGEALTVFDLAKDVPNAARKILPEHPDTLLRIQVTEAIESQLGPILLTTRGLLVGGKLLGDPNGLIEQQAFEDDDWRLRFGSYRFKLEKKLPARFPEQLREWLTLWAERYAANAENLGRRTDKVPRLVGSLVVACPLCQEQLAIRRGLIGTPWAALG